MKYFSPSTGFFYDEYTMAVNAPQEAVVEVSEADFAELMELRATGAQIISDDQGRPVAVPATNTAAMQQAIKRAAINRTYEEACGIFKSRYPRTEVDGWPEQVRALEQYDANPSAPNVLIDILAQHNGRTRAEMGEDIRTARARFVFAYAQLTGLRQKLEADLNAISLLAANAESLIGAIDETQLTALAQQLQQAGG